MRGYLREKRPGYWELVVALPPDPVTRKRRQKRQTFRGGRRGAEDALRRLCNEVAGGRYRGTEQTVAYLLARWTEHAGPSWSPRTAEKVEEVIRLHIAPAIGSRPLAKLAPADLDKLYRTMSANGLSAARVRTAHSVIRRALAQAERWEWVERNVAAKASPPSVRQPEVKAPTPAEVLEAIAAAEDRYPGLALFLHLAAVTGARRGELCGLRWSDVDLAAGAVRISRAIVEVRDDRSLLVKEPKAGRGRTVAVDPATAERVRTHMAAMAERAMVNGVALVSDPYVFSHSARAKALNGSVPWRPYDVSRYWRRVREGAGLQHVQLRSLRHFSATQLIDGGIPLPTVSRRVGHSRQSTTSDVYVAWLPHGDQEAARVIAERLSPPRTVQR